MPAIRVVVTYCAELHPSSPGPVQDEQRPAQALAGAKMMDPDAVSC